MTGTSADGADLIKSLRDALGRRCDLTTTRSTRRFRQGFRGLVGDALDPTNSLNPGIGQTAVGRDWADTA